MPLSPGDRLGPYEILSPLGAGGMGEVWKARDTRLDRTVAVKVLPKFIADRDDLRARFEREARAVSSLKHPNICVLFDIGKQHGIDFMVLEHLEGETLAARASKGPLPLDQVLKYATQIADALDRAHRSDVCHRDVKPANIMLTRDGVKVLDFGLAKTARTSRIGSDDVTGLAAALTSEGTILGTPQYMAPEQYEGREADERSDIFAFGCVVYEMVTGRRCFDGKTKASLIAAVLGGEPVAMSALVPVTPPALERLVKRCIEKDPEDRYQSMRDVVLDLRSIGVVGTEVKAQAKGLLYKAAWVVAGVAIIAAAAVSFVHFREKPPARPLARLQLATPGPAAAHYLALSPDGRMLAFVAGNGGADQLWVRALDSLDARALAGTSGAAFPFWSPDSTSLGFFAERKLKKIAVSGGPAQALCEVGDPRGGTWNRDGVILFSPGPASPILRVSAAGGVPAPVTALPPGDSAAGHRFPVYLPDGVHFLYNANAGKADTDGVYVASLAGGEPVRLLPDRSNAVFAPPAAPGGTGQLLFRRDGTLMAQPFDPRSLKPTGEVVPMAENVVQDTYAGLGTFSVSEGGSLVYRSAVTESRELARLDRSGRRLGTVGKPGDYTQIALSPDEKSVALIVNNGAQSDIWLEDIARGETQDWIIDWMGKNLK